MQFMILRRSDRTTEAADFPPPELAAAMPSAKWLHPSASGVRMRRAPAGEWTVRAAPFADAGELVAGYTFIEAADRDAALAWAAKAWPTADAEGEALIEVREAGCPGGCVGFDTGEAPQGPAWAVLLRSDQGSEADLEPPPAVIDTMNRANQAGVRAGLALAGEGLKSTARGGRVKFSGGRPSIIDGPFTEVKELIAGYWLIRADTLEQAMDWVRNYPYPHPDELEIELRTVHR
ncbi:YciI family protein [Pseudoduganella namucuonensis]|uniref:Uncharacterized conserved protein n=1 Tax=Pseudoduganella namucuonensis TaxID=1035707 RepID=A0A1I7JM06_9BURK|nr:YciI family protein [Pseudoduganella namucuonensis]SFU86203.1 Uncharacterized conserved protein [Pseudoduganella namucuonensis]